MTQKEIFELWDVYSPRVYGYFFKRLQNREDVDDLTSITMQIFLDKLQTTKIKNQHAYLWKIAYSQFVLFLHQKSKQPVSVTINDEFEAPDDSIEKMRSENFKRVSQEILSLAQEKLKPDEFHIFNQIILEDQKAVDLAKELHLTPENVRQKFKRLLTKLRLEWKNLYPEFPNN